MSFSRHTTWRILLVILLLFELLICIPWRPIFGTDEIDASWTMALRMAWIHGVDFGHDVVFTYGPWGFTISGYHPATFYLTVLCWGFFGCAYFAALVKLACSMTPRIWVRGIWLVLMMCVSHPNSGYQGTHILAICAALLVLHFYADDQRDKWVKTLLTIAMGLISLGKFSMAVAAAGVIGAISVDQVLRRRMPRLLAVYVLSIAVFWIAARQPASSFLPWVRNSMELSSGHSSSMSLDNESELQDVRAFALTAAAFLVLVVAFHVHRRTRLHGLVGFGRPIIVIAALAGMVLVYFKSGFVRHDGHEVLTVASLLTLALMFVTATWQLINRPILKVASLVVMAACITLASRRTEHFTGYGLAGDIGQTLASAPPQFIAAAKWLVGRSGLEGQYRDNLKVAGALRSLPAVTGTVDYYPKNSLVVMANGLNYHPRPIMQSYTVYSSRLLRMNADFLKSSTAPDEILWESLPLDVRYPSQDDAASWPELLTRYDLKDASHAVLLLERSSHPRSYAFTPLQEATGTLGGWVDVPQTGQPVWVKIHLEHKAVGELIDAVYKTPQVQLHVATVGGLESTWRLIPGIAQDGFLLSPQVVDRLGFAVLQSRDWQTQLGPSAIARMCVTVDNKAAENPYFARSYRVAFSNLEFEHADVSGVPGIADYERFLSFVRRMKISYSAVRPGGVMNDDSRNVLLAWPVTQLMDDPPAAAREVDVAFGMLSESYTGPARSDGVEFRVYAARPVNAQEADVALLWSRKLDPANHVDDRGLQHVQLKLPSPLPQRIIFETLPVNDATADYSYWADIDYR